MSRTKCLVVGASGYTGAELLRLLLRHPGAELVGVTSRQYAGSPLPEIFPRYRGVGNADALAFIEPDVSAMTGTDAAFAFLALPHGVASEYARPLVEAGVRVIDLSADFRLNSPSVYEEFYGATHPDADLMEEAVYGLPEIYAEEIKSARLVASPGCYPTSILLPLLPLLRAKSIDPGSIHVASMSGVSGAGKKADTKLLFVECNESVRPYSVPKHRHLSEIEQELSIAAGETVAISFTPHLVPVNAGICSTTYAATEKNAAEIGELLESVYAHAPFVRLLGENGCPDTKNVVGTNFIDIGWARDDRTGRAVLMSAEDNLGKGAGSQAIQSFNLMAGLEETKGIL
ncbi:MAG: N-acetyl-gamma-glutamyl-phosphate reductase [Verrucomicrobiota bacterium]